MLARELLAAGGAATVLGFAATGIAVPILRRRLVAEETERSSHTGRTPTGGGIGIAAAVLVAGGGTLALIGEGFDATRVGLPLVAAVAAGAVGVLDDAREMRPRLKMALLLACAAAVLPVATLTGASAPFAGPLGFGWAAIPLSLFWLLGFTNVFNFMDGINGIAAVTTAVSGSAFALLGAARGDVDVALLGGITAGAAAGFLPWNFPNARVFMGDAGSLALGLLLATLGILSAEPVAEIPAVAFPACVLLLGPFLLDTTLTLIRRAARGERLGEAHREHLYQKLSDVWKAHPPVTLLYGAFSVATAVLAWGYGDRGDFGRLLSLVLPLGAMLVFAAVVLRAERRLSSPASDRNS